MFSELMLGLCIGVPVRTGCTLESEKQEEDFEILLLPIVVMALIVETMDQDAIRKKISSFKMGDMIGFVYCIQFECGKREYSRRREELYCPTFLIREKGGVCWNSI